jgi:agmatinase
LIKYKPTDSQASPRFCGVRTFMRLPHVQTVDDIDFAVIGVPFDTGATLKVGARFGPEAIRSSSIILKPYNMFLDVNIFEHCSGVDYGDLPVVPGYIKDSNDLIEKSLSPLIENGVIPVLLGGDHSVTLPELRAVVKTYGPVALIHFDSHTDTMDKYFGRSYNHGTPFRRAVDEKLRYFDNSIQIGLRGQQYQPDDLEESKRLGFETMTSVEVQDMGRENVIEKIHNRVKDTKAFVTFDIDFVDPAFAPGTGTPEVGGFTSAETLRLVRGLKGLDMVGFDVVEVLPAYDPSQITSLLAANIAYEFISLIALNKKNSAD